MDDATAALPDQFLADLRQLCAQPSSTGQMDELKTTARLVAELLRRAGLQVRVVPTAGAPVVLGWRNGQTSTRLLLYHHYDVAPTGPWRHWFHEPFRLAERDQLLYGRGVAHGKGPLAAHLHALRTVLDGDDDPPCGLVVVVEGEALNGSPHLASVIEAHADLLQADACLSVGGERDSHDRPFCYGGAKGLLRVRLSAQGPDHPLTSGMAASVPNPVWRLTWALNHIKGEDEDIRINGFYDSITGPGRGEREVLRKVSLNEAGRLEAWNIPTFLFGMSGAALVRSEVTLPTCNLHSFVVEPASDHASIPVSASARLDFQLVPDQQPDPILGLLRKHLLERGCFDITIEALPGSYPPIRDRMEHPLFQQLVTAGERVYGEPLALLPIGAFAQPLHIFAQQLGVPVVALALARHNSAIHGPNECLPGKDLIHHSQIITELLLTYHTQPRHVEVAS